MNYLHMLTLLAQVGSEVAETEVVVQDADPISLVILLAVAILSIVAGWKVYSKGGKPGWACLVPIYNVIAMLQIAGRPVWWIILLLIPIVNVVIIFLLSLDLAKSFGKSALFGVGLFFLGFIFYPILAFSDAEYQGPAAAQA